MQVKVMKISKRSGTAKESGKPYNLLFVLVAFTVADGTDVAELMLDGDATPPELNKVYELELRWYADQSRKLRFAVDGFRPVDAVRKAA